MSHLFLGTLVLPLLIERRDDVSRYPRARNRNSRTMEIFRGLGLSDGIHAAGNSPDQKKS
jgi:putative polyketide hydroxylase